MIIIEFEKNDKDYADKICELATMSIVITEPRSFSSDLNNIIQIGVQLAPSVVSAVTLILVEMIKKNKKVKFKVSDDSFEVEGLSEERALELAEKYINQKREDEAKKILNKLLSGGK